MSPEAIVRLGQMVLHGLGWSKEGPGNAEDTLCAETG